jgi:hypothetical protein
MTNTNLPKRLRDGTKITCGWSGEDIIDPLLLDAADEIERLEHDCRAYVAAIEAHGQDEEDQSAEIERLNKALAVADVVCHTIYNGNSEHSAVLDAYWHARGGIDACTVCSPPEKSCPGQNLGEQIERGS